MPKAPLKIGTGNHNPWSLGGDRKNCAKGRSVGFSCRRDHRVLQVPVQLDLNSDTCSE
jgi:hypothetical protein